MTIKLPPMPHGGTLIIAEDVGSRAYGKHDMEAYAREAVRLNMAPLSDEQINRGRIDLPYDVEDLPEPWAFREGVRFAERAHGIKGD